MLREMLIENIDLLSTCGFVKPVTQCSILDVPTIVQTVALHLVILNSKAELDQLSEGMTALGVLDAIKKVPDLPLPFYTNSGSEKLTAAYTHVHVHMHYRSILQRKSGVSSRWCSS